MTYLCTEKEGEGRPSMHIQGQRCRKRNKESFSYHCAQRASERNKIPNELLFSFAYILEDGRSCTWQLVDENSNLGQEREREAEIQIEMKWISYAWNL